MTRPAATQKASAALPDRSVAQRRFDAVAAGFDAACAIHDHARATLLNRLRWFELEPQCIVDLGCGTGRGSAALQALYPTARILGIDTSSAMLQHAADRCPSASLLRGDAACLPLADASVELLLACLVLPWCEPQAVLREAARVLAPGGVLLAATTGPRTLEQLRRAWRSVDEAVHVHAGFDMQMLGDFIAQAALAEPVLDTELVTLQYSGSASLHAELRAVAAVNAAAGRRRTLTGRRRYEAYEKALTVNANGGLAVSVELIFAQAFGAEAASAPTASFHGIPIQRG